MPRNCAKADRGVDPQGREEAPKNCARDRGPSGRERGIVRCWKRLKKGMVELWAGARSLYPAKAAAGLCTRLARSDVPLNSVGQAAKLR